MEDDNVSPVESGEQRRLRHLVIGGVVVCAVAIVCYVVWGLIELLTLGNTDEGPVAVAYRLVGVPAWLVMLGGSIVWLVSAACEKRGAGQRVVAAVLVALMALACYLFAVQPLLDVPYLLDPVRVELRDVEVEEREGTDTANHYLTGVDDAGREWEFRINYGTYRSWDPARTTATVIGLPNTQVTLSIE